MEHQVVKPRTMPGVLELLPREQQVFQGMLDTIRRGYELHGFQPLDTPVMELTDVLLTKTGGETERQVYFVQSTGALQQQRKPELALRFDLTVPLARYVAEHENDLTFPFRRYHLAKVYRGESAQRGRFREFYQCDIDIIGRNELGLLADAEIPVVVHHVFTKLGLGKFTIWLNNRKLLQGLFEGLGVTDGEQRALVLREIDKIDKRGRDAVVKTLLAEPFSLPAATLDRVLGVIELCGAPAQVIPALEKVDVASDLYRAGVAELRAVTDAMAASGVPEADYAVKPAIARGLDYYTGTVYETTLDAHPDIGSICSGGRYEDLASHYTRTRLPGVGISIGLTRLFWQLKDAGLLKPAAPLVKVLVTQMDPALNPLYLRLATTLRQAGINTEVHQDGLKFAKQMNYANKAGIPWAVIVGQDEASRGLVRVKHLPTGEQVDLGQDTLVDHLRAHAAAGER
jgi:histidyl-tRNA synthetase